MRRRVLGINSVADRVPQLKSHQKVGLTISEARHLYKKHGSYRKAAKAAGCGYETMRRRVLGLSEDQPLSTCIPDETFSEVIADVTEGKEAKKSKALSEKIGSIESKYLSFLTKNGRRPTMLELQRMDIPASAMRVLFGNIHEMHEHMEAKHPDSLAEHLASSNVLFTRERMDRIDGLVGKHRRFFVTTVVANKVVHDGFLKAIDSFCEKNDAVLLMLPCADVWDRQTGSGIVPLTIDFDSRLNERNVISRKVALNDSLSLSDMRVSAKQINPLTAISRMAQRDGSFIMASPKQQLEYVATSNDKKLPHALMSTGALTVPDYRKDRYMSERQSNIAEHDHVMGGIVVEVIDDRFFQFRQVQANLDGSFIDLCTLYMPNGKTKHEPANLILGDYHAGATDEMVKECIQKLLSDEDITVEKIFLHDFFDGFSINHHDIDVPGKMTRKYRIGAASLRDELMIGVSELEWLLGQFDGDMVVVKSNHDEFIDKYLDSGRYVKDPLNSDLAHRMRVQMNDGVDPLKWAYEHCGLRGGNRINWLRRDESYILAKTELGAHGDLGPNGSKGSLRGIESAYGNCIVGHAHVAAILRGVYRVGTCSRLSLDYNRGPSSWTHTSCLHYKNGGRQLINFIDGDYRLRD